MQEYITQKVIDIEIKAAKLTTNVLTKALKLFLESQKQKGSQPKQKQGKQSLKKLVGQNAGVSSIEISDGNIKSFEHVAKKYGVDFAVKKDKTVDPPKYHVFFKGRDTDVLTQCFKEYVKKNEKKQERRVSVKKKLAQFKKVAEKSKGKVKERTREKARAL